MPSNKILLLWVAACRDRTTPRTTTNTLIIQAAYARGVFSEDFPSIRFGFQHVLPYFCTHIIVLKLHARDLNSTRKKTDKKRQFVPIRIPSPLAILYEAWFGSQGRNKKNINHHLITQNHPVYFSHRCRSVIGFNTL